MRYAFHFGVVPTGLVPVAVDGHWDTTTEHEFDLLGHKAYVSGSWACWGPADQETDGDDTLHVLVHVQAEDDSEAGDLLPGLRRALAKRLGPESRLLDYGVISDQDDWSRDQVVFTLDGSTFYIAVAPL